MRLFFIRHGQTTGDVEDRYGGAYDDHLSDEGRRQVLALAGELADAGIEAIYSSSLIRARETSGLLADKLGCPVVVEAGLRERDQYGPLTGMVKAEAKAQYPEMAALLKDRNNTLPGAESYADAVARMAVAVARVESAGHGCAAVVWHGGGMRALFREILKKGEIAGDCGDCCWVALGKRGKDWEITDSRRLAFAFKV